MREITIHREVRDIHGVAATIPDPVGVFAVDEPGEGGACHVYEMRVNGPGVAHKRVSFQNGPVKEAGVNGISNEALLAVIIDRMEGLANGPFPCAHNDIALTSLRNAMETMQDRTLDRMARGVEGASKA